MTVRDGSPRLLLIGDAGVLEPLARALRTEGASARVREPGAGLRGLLADARDVDAVVIEDIGRAATVLDAFREQAASVLRVLMVGVGAVRDRGEERLHELLFPRVWTRAEARILCAWVRSNKSAR